MRVYDLKCVSLENPIGVDIEPYFDWRIESERRGTCQSAYSIEVAEDEEFKRIIWKSEVQGLGFSIGAKYTGKPLQAMTRYYWRVAVSTNKGESAVSDTAYFETGLMSTDLAAWRGAKWICGRGASVNTAGVKEYALEYELAVEGDKTEIAIAARNQDNYVGIELNFAEKRAYVREYSDNAWNGEYGGGNAPYIAVLGEKVGYGLPETALKGEPIRLGIEVNLRNLKLTLNGEKLLDAEIMPPNILNRPRKVGMFLTGVRQDSGRCTVKALKISANGELLADENSTAIRGLGEKGADGIALENAFNLINPVPALNVRRIFKAKGTIKKARIYAAARGFYKLYINGESASESFYNPGFTDYRKRIQYQTYDITDRLKAGKNSIAATAAKGYYSGYVGYCGEPMVYGRRNSFIALTVIEYESGERESIVTDESWEYSFGGAVVDADYLDGEYYNAMLELDAEDEDSELWQGCAIAKAPEYASATNGVIENEKFELSAQYADEARIERILKPVGTWEMPKGHFVFDFGQNLTGTVRLKMRGIRGRSLKLRYGEMCYKSGEVYLQNLRMAANTDVYVMRGGCEKFTPEFTSHGFRYLEITGHGRELTAEEFKALQISAEGLVITNTREMTGEFECSEPKINKLQSNIVWGQRGNSLLVFTDCPQRNERMGWTGDAQVFGATAAYNMNVRAFMDKWLKDLRDAQRLYNRNGAVPDTAPLGGDNRPAGCAGWGDAAVIVPWEMYKAYGDERILSENYEMMRNWIEYQSRSDRQNCGMRTVDGAEQPEKSDLSERPFIQVQQSRGDHLAYDMSTPFILSATAYAARVAYIMSRVSEILGKDADRERYAKRFEDIKRAFNDAWVREDGSMAYYGEMSKGEADDSGNIINQTRYCEDSENAKPSQTAYALAIDFGLIEGEKLKRAAQCLKRAIDERDGCLSVGFLGISHLMSALEKAGLTETAYRLLMNERNPSWLYSVVNGATTIWERWNSYTAETGEFGNALMNSFNHYSYGAVGEWLYGTVLGINSSDKKGETGYRHIIFKPVFGGFEWARGSYMSAVGKIMAAWHKDGVKYIYEISVPTSAAASLKIPNGYSCKCLCGAEYVAEKEKGMYALTSGKYTFELEERNDV